MKTIKPASNQLFCKPQDPVKKTTSGFLLSDSATEKTQIADVINVGESVKQFKPHDSIIYKSYSTTTVKIDGTEYLLMSEDDVLGVIIEAADEQD